MFTYLCETYPDAFTYRSKFGDVLYVSKEYAHHFTYLYVTSQLVTLFCCSGYDADNAYETWKASRPIFVPVVNSTNEVVLLPLETECNTTV